MSGWTIPFLMVLMVALASCGNDGAPTTDRSDSGVLHISADESFKPVLDAQIQVFESQNPKAKIIAHYKPEAECLADFAVDSIRAIIATRSFTEAERRFMNDSLLVGPQSFPLAYDAIAVIVHPTQKDSFFTLADLRGIVSGNTKKNLIPVFDGNRATSTVRFMLDSVLRGQPLGTNVVAAQTSQGVIDYVARTPNAVGFLGISWIGNTDDSVQVAQQGRVRIARIESTDSLGGFVLPVQYLIYSRTYPLVRSLVYVLKERHIGLANGFVAFMRSDAGQLLFRRAFLQPAVRGFYMRDTQLE